MGEVILCVSDGTKDRVHHTPTVQAHWMHVREPEQFSEHVGLVNCPTCLRHLTAPTPPADVQPFMQAMTKAVKDIEGTKR